MNKEFDVLDFFFNWKGRISRKHYWLGRVCLALIGYTIFSLSFSLIFSFFGLRNIPSLILFWTSMVIFIFAGLCLDIKRFHDRGKSGHWLCLNLLSLIGSIWFFIQPESLSGHWLWLHSLLLIGSIWILIELNFLKGTKGPNKYGEDTLKEIKN